MSLVCGESPPAWCNRVPLAPFPLLSFAFLDLVSTEAAGLAIRQLDGKLVNGRLITVAFPKRTLEPAKESNGDMPVKMAALRWNRKGWYRELS